MNRILNAADQFGVHGIMSIADDTFIFKFLLEKINLPFLRSAITTIYDKPTVERLEV